MGSLHHSIATSNPEAQRFFDQGLTLVYAFNHDEAIRSFRRAAELDPSAAMPWWGVALALGPNYNDPGDPEKEKAAYDAVQKAKSLAAAGPASERAYIETLSLRYSSDPNADLKKRAHDYSGAMGDLAKRYPDDPDAATIYAESMMDLRPWGLWNPDGTPAEGTLEIIAVLESVLASYPNHVGANHYYIHAVEASPHAAWAVADSGGAEKDDGRGLGEEPVRGGLEGCRCDAERRKFVKFSLWGIRKGSKKVRFICD
jgi:tetratricopeptide (TPR) repeat protein